MCLEVFALAATKERVGARRLSEVSGLRVEKRNRPVKDALCFSRDGGCSCSLLSDTAGIEDETWDLDSAVLPGLAAAVKALAEEANGLTFQATWVGESPKARERAALRELLGDISENRVKNRHVYVIGRAAV